MTEYIKGAARGFIHRLSQRMLAGFCSRFVVLQRGSWTCWKFRGVLSPDGYGLVHFQAKGAVPRTCTTAHRVAYELWVGSIPNGYEPDHLCDYRPCINPDHLEIITHRENVRRSRARNLAATHCWRGHALTTENIIMHHGWRVCRTCRPDVVRRAA